MIEFISLTPTIKVVPTQIDYWEFEYDKNKNWIKRISFRNGTIQSRVERIIESLNSDIEKLGQEEQILYKRISANQCEGISWESENSLIISNEQTELFEIEIDTMIRLKDQKN